MFSKPYLTGLNLRPVQWVPRLIAEIRADGQPDLMRTHTMTTLYRKDLGAPKDFTESRNIVCMIDRVCCVMYRCNYELLISPYNLFHPTTTNTLQPGRLLITKKAGELRKAFLKASLHFFLRSLRFSNVTPPGTMPKQG